MVKILANGNWSPAQVRVTRVASSSITNAAVDRAIDQAWEAAISRPGVKLFDGPMCRLESWRVFDDSLHLTLSATTYKRFLGTNLTHPEFADVYGANLLANPVGLSAALLTADGFLMLGRRNASLAYYPQRIHPFAGCLEPGDGDDLFHALRRELSEELRFEPADVAEVACIGIVEDATIRQPELVFAVRTPRSRYEVEERVDAAEHFGSCAIPATPDGIAHAIENPALTPVAAGTLRLLSGSSWIEPA